ncbi:hypothetical protein [Sediminicurvatus halobius]|uniref:hypothetical protein n=1 Tax=Sediminicurvatus halobius TaxID=2182432 RepID=UPI001304C16F|nr:hypothetical protein [Spiribacter halobius]UEX77923.1 hypothetical protein LMH63_18665 [Spiribacter halobius]
MPQENRTAFPDAMSLLSGLNAIRDEFCRQWLTTDTESLQDPVRGLEHTYRQQLRAARTAVDGVLALEHRYIEQWQGLLPETTGSWETPRTLLAVSDAAVDTRAQLWHAWFEAIEQVGTAYPFNQPVAPEAGAEGAAASHDADASVPGEQPAADAEPAAGVERRQRSSSRAAR